MHRISGAFAYRFLVSVCFVAFSMFAAGCGWVDSGVGGNAPPDTSAVQADYTVVAGSTLTVSAADGVLKDVQDGGNTPPTARLTAGPQHASAFNLASDGSFSYTHDGSNAASDSFTYVANDGIEDSAPVTASIRIEHPPVSADDVYDADPGQPLNVAAKDGVLQNDTDANAGDTLTAKLETPPSTGQLQLAADGGFVYTPQAGVVQRETFTYRANDGTADSDPAKVTIRIRPQAANDPATSGDPQFQTPSGIPVSLPVLANDSDPDGSLDPQGLAVIRAPAHGKAVPAGDGTVTYTPAAGFIGTDNFDYTVTDNDGATSNAATVTVSVIQPNAAPVAVNDSAATRFGAQVSIDVLNNDYDTDGSLDKSTVTIVTPPVAGTASVEPDGKITYTATASGTFTFTYTVADDQGAASNAATVTVVVSANLAPLANADSATTTQGKAVSIAVLDNDSDPDGQIDKGSVLIDTAPSGGTAAVKGDGKVDYQPNADFIGTDEFRYTVADNDGTRSAPASVSIVVASSED